MSIMKLLLKQNEGNSVCVSTMRLIMVALNEEILSVSVGRLLFMETAGSRDGGPLWRERSTNILSVNLPILSAFADSARDMLSSMVSPSEM